MKEALSGVDSPKNHPCYLQDTIENGIHLVKFKPVDTAIEVMVPRHAVIDLVNVEFTDEGKLIQPTKIKDAPKAYFVKQHFSGVIPEYFFPQHVKFNVHKLENDFM